MGAPLRAGRGRGVASEVGGRPRRPELAPASSGRVCRQVLGARRAPRSGSTLFTTAAASLLLCSVPSPSLSSRKTRPPAPCEMEVSEGGRGEAWGSLRVSVVLRCGT